MRAGGLVESMTDEQLVSLAHQGNANAYNNLTERWESSLYRFTRRMLGNPEDARDVCQEALVKAYLNINSLREGAKFRAWIHYIALNLCRDRFRSQKSRTVLHPYEEGGVEAIAEGVARTRQWSTERQIERASLKDLMEEVLAELPVEQRTAIVLREYQGFTSDEIAEMTGTPAATVRSRIFYGFKALRKKLRERGITAENMQ
jgi:RNA polymerase sigma-70 factor (ECF subfamily)